MKKSMTTWPFPGSLSSFSDEHENDDGAHPRNGLDGDDEGDDAEEEATIALMALLTAFVCSGARRGRQEIDDEFKDADLIEDEASKKRRALECYEKKRRLRIREEEETRQRRKESAELYCESGRGWPRGYRRGK